MMFNQFHTEEKLMNHYRNASTEEQEFMVESLISMTLTRAEAENQALRMQQEAMEGHPCNHNFYRNVMPLWMVQALDLD